MPSRNVTITINRTQLKRIISTLSVYASNINDAITLEGHSGRKLARYQRELDFTTGDLSTLNSCLA
jgi:hypothetical protein